jgi:hypothetical protein
LELKLTMAYGTALLDTITSSGNLTVNGNLSTIGTIISSSDLSITGNVSATGTISSSAGVTYPLISGTSQNSTSGTSIDFTSIPSWVKRITIMFAGVSTSGSSNKLVQIGSGTVTTTGYTSTSISSTNGTGVAASSTSGFIIASGSSSDILSGSLQLFNLTGNQWVLSGTLKVTTSYVAAEGGDVSLSGILTRVRITTVNGTDTFTAGTINIMYE